MNSKLAEIIVCDRCGGKLANKPGELHCQQCHRSVPLQREIAIFTPSPENLQPSEKLVRGPNVGTPWRQANWRFLQKQITSLEQDALILDVGAGRGDFADLFNDRNYLALDIYPYPEVDLVCDLTQSNPFRPESIDVILLMNVLEHVYDTQTLLDSLNKTLKEGGLLIVTIPFMVKMHQVPVDYVRYTHYALERLGSNHGFEIELIEGYYDPLFLLGEGIGNLKWSVLPTIRGTRHYLGRVLLAGIQALANTMHYAVGTGNVQSPARMRSLAPIGYHLVFRKKPRAAMPQESEFNDR